MTPSGTAAAPSRNTPNFDRLAHVYRWMEYLSFGPMLERCRFYFLPECFDARRALVLGDGDGRFTARLLASNPRVEIDAIDSSAAMLKQLQRRASAASTTGRIRVRTVQADLRDFTSSDSGYDLVVSHFFLDCLTEEEVAALVERTIPNLAPNASWLVSEFAIPEEGRRRRAARMLVRFLYFAFRKMVHLQVREIPDYSRVLKRSGFRQQQQASFLGGLLIAEVWRRAR